MMSVMQPGSDVAAGVIATVLRGSHQKGLEKDTVIETGHMRLRLGEKVHVRRAGAERGMIITTAIRLGTGRKIGGEMRSEQLNPKQQLASRRQIVLKGISDVLIKV